MKKLIILTLMLVLFSFTFFFVTCEPTPDIIITVQGDKYFEGDKVSITYQVKKSSGITSINIDLYNNNTLSASITKALSVTVYGTDLIYDWTVPDTSYATTYRIRITDANNPEIYAESDAITLGYDPTKAHIKIIPHFTWNNPSLNVYGRIFCMSAANDSNFILEYEENSGPLAIWTSNNYLGPPMNYQDGNWHYIYDPMTYDHFGIEPNDINLDIDKEEYDYGAISGSVTPGTYSWIIFDYMYNTSTAENGLTNIFLVANVLDPDADAFVFEAGKLYSITITSNDAVYGTAKYPSIEITDVSSK